MRTRAFLIVLAIAVLAVAGGWRALDGAQAGGATFTVDSVADVVDAAPGNGVCATAAGACTLRAAIQESNALAGPDTISLPAGAYALTAIGPGEDAGASGDLDVLDDVTITGAGASGTIIDGTAQDRVLDVDPGATGVRVEISGLTVRNGDTLEGGGILNSGELTLRECVVTGNHAGAGGGVANRAEGILTLDRTDLVTNTAGVAGAINNSGSVTMENGSLSGNETNDDGGAMVNYGTITGNDMTFQGNTSGDNGGIYWGSGSLTLTNSLITGNTAADEGGAIINFSGGDVTLLSSVVSGNRAVNLRGGALVNFRVSTMTLTNTTVDGNSAAGNGGGILSDGTLSVDGSTISDNTSGANGGGIYTTLTTSMTNATVSGNAAMNGGGVFNSGTLTAASVTIASNTGDGSGGGIAGPGGALVRNTILAGNSPDNCSGGVGSLGHNLDDGTSCGFGQATDVTNAGALLEPLGDNGGETQTHALAPASPAVDGGDDAACPPIDQRGVARPQGARCDIGAFELGGVPGLPGDANCDGVTNSLDAAIVLQYAAGLVDDLPCLEAADANGDGRVDAIDAALILQYDAGLLDQL